MKHSDKMDRIKSLTAPLKGEPWNDARQVFDALEEPRSVYPNFDAWFDRVCLELRTGSRNVITCRRNERIIAIAIAKRSVDERKLCTLWVDRTARGQRIGTDLASAAFDWLETRRPLFTVPEQLILDFSPMLARWRFDESARAIGYYRPGQIEHVFNGAIL
jgi:hypothetical protein